MPLFLALLLAVQPFANLNGYVASPLFYLTVAGCLALLVHRRFAGAGSVTRDYRWVIGAYSLLLLAVSASSLYYGDWAGANGEGAIRLFLGFWVVLLAMEHVPARYLQWASVLGFGVAGVVSAGIVLYLTLPDFIRPPTPGHNAVTYGNVLAYMAVVAVFSMGWQLTRWCRTEQVVKLVFAVLALCGFVLTQSRSGWVAMPVFALLGAVLFVGLRNRARTLGAALIALAVLAGVFASSDMLRQRTVEGYNEVISCQGDGALQVTSVCIRLQLYRASIDMFSQSPWVGIGDGGRFHDEMVRSSHPKGLVSDYVVNPQDYFGEPHNDLLFMLASFGLPGFLGLLLAFVAPCWYFVRRLGSAVPQPARVAAAMGLALCLGFMIFGFTETMFRRMHMLGFYAMFVAVFLSLSDPRRYRPNRTDLHS